MKEKIGKESVCEVAKQQAEQDYQNWKVEHEGYGYQRLEDWRSQEIVRLLMSGILKKAPVPTGREVKERSVVIDMDALEVGTTLPENLDVLCAQLSPFVFWTGQKKEILSVDYERMDNYLLRHQADITEEARYAFDYFDTVVNLIQEDMALLKPQLARYLKNYDENLLERSRKECIDVVNACQPLMKPNIRTDLLCDVVRKLLNDKRIGEEVQTKLCSIKTRNKYLCEIIAALDYFGVFKAEVVRRTLAKTLSQNMVSVSIGSADDYIKKFQSAKSGVLFEWMKENLEDLKAHEYNPYAGLLLG